MSIKNSLFSHNFKAAYNDIKKKLGNDAADANLKASHGKRKEKIDDHQGATAMLHLRKEMNVDQKTLDQMRSGTWKPRNLEQVVKYFDRATGFHGDATAGKKGGAALPISGATLVKAAMDHAKQMHNDGAGTDAIHESLQKDLAVAVFQKIAGHAGLSEPQVLTATLLASTLMKGFAYDAKSHKLKFVADMDAGDQLAAGRKDSKIAQRFFDKKTEKVLVRAKLSTQQLTKLGHKVQQLSNSATRKVVNAATSTVAGAAMGVQSAALASVSPVVVAGRVAMNVGEGLGRGVAAGAKVAGSTIKQRTAKDAQFVAEQLAPVQGPQSEPKKSKPRR